MRPETLRAALPGLGIAVAVALLVRWPVSIQPGALPMDPNTAMHAVIAADFADHLDPFRIHGLGFPDGVPYRAIGWPLLILGIPFQWVFVPIVAYNLTLTAWLALQVLVVDRLGLRLGWTLPCRLVAMVAAGLAPQVLTQHGNGSWENIVVGPAALVLLGAVHPGRFRALLGVGGMLLAAACSPYQGLACGLLLLAGLPAGRRLDRVLSLSGLAAVALAVFLYDAVLVGTPDATPAAGVVRPTRGVFIATASVADLALPVPSRTIQPQVGEDPTSILGAVPTSEATRLGFRERLDLAVTRPGLREPGWSTWRAAAPLSSAYVGWALGGLGLAGLWLRRREHDVRMWGLAGLVCTSLAFGPRLYLTDTLRLPVPLPWELLGRLPGLDQMLNTIRLLGVPSLVLAVGAGLWVDGRRLRAVGAMGLLLLDGMAGTPGGWPVAASVPAVGGIQAALPEGPVALWPPLPSVTPYHHALLQVSLDRPAAIFLGQEGDPIGAHPPTVVTRDRNGVSPTRWLLQARSAGAGALLELGDLQGPLVQPFFPTRPPVTEGWRVYLLEGWTP